MHFEIDNLYMWSLKEEMEDLSRLLLEERAHSEQFKTNFTQLKAEFDK